MINRIKISANMASLEVQICLLNENIVARIGLGDLRGSETQLRLT
jgi:hypothetical protein